MKRGFTLVELLGVFTIMAVIMLVSVPVITGMIKQGEDQKYENFKSNVFLSAEAYINDNMSNYPSMKTIGGYEYVSFQELIENDYLNSLAYDPKTGVTVKEEMDYTVIATVMDNYTYSYTISTERLYKDTAPPIIESINVVNKVATFQISDNMELQGYAITSSTDIPSVWTNTGNVLIYSNSYTATTHGTYYLHAIDYIGNTSYQSFIIEASAFSYAAILSNYAATLVNENYVATPVNQNYTATTTNQNYAASSSTNYCDCIHGSLQGIGHCNYDVSVGISVMWRTTYSCPVGGTLSGTTCILTGYTCPSGGTLSGTTCILTGYTCPSGGTLSGTTCIKSSYTCPSGGTLSGTTCSLYTCPNGGTLSGTTCVIN